ncbi:MAG: hypothetical protein H0U75_00555, partial [Legionella sp.]|nr:hypothetical protein [Legionella sp.]
AMSSISYTLNTGRSHYPHRGVWIAEDSASLQEQLSLSLDHKTSQGIFIGVVDKDKKPDDEAIYENVLADTLGRLKTVGNLDGPSYFKTLRTLGNLYVKGYAIDWEILHQDEVKQRMSLPTYPFAKERYWLSGLPQSIQAPPSVFVEQAIFPPTQLKNENEQSPLLSAIQGKLIEFVAEVLKRAPTKIMLNDNLINYGFDSITFTELSKRLNTYYKFVITPALFYEYATINALAEQLLEHYKNEVASKHQNLLSNNKEDASDSVQSSAQHMSYVKPNGLNKYHKSTTVDAIAIIGMAGIFPGAADVNDFWKNLVSEHDAITHFPAERVELNPAKSFINWGGFINDIDTFDAEFFKIFPREAELMDPQQRIFLMTVCKSIEDAGYAIEDFNDTLTSLFVGVGSQDYFELLIQTGKIEGYTLTGMAHNMLPNRVSYLLGLKGTSEAIDTACSSSLVALHRAVQSIETGECELAIAGGVNGLVSSSSFIGCVKAGMLSADGRCKTFDKSANGYVRGEGVGALVLKPLSKAQADGDHIYGVIKGSAVNHGGQVNTLTTPNPNAQAEVIKVAYRKAQVTPDSISYIEAHGTGTALGDPIEINGLKKAFRDLAKEHQQTLGTQYCAIGSVKTNIGHLETAAGIAGVIKVLLAMQHDLIPASLHCQELNPYIELEASPFYIATGLQKWERLQDAQGKEIPRRAGISSFGFGGSNAHVIIEEGPKPTSVSSTKPYYLISLSAKTALAFREKQQDMLNWLNDEDKTCEVLSSISYTLNMGRSHLNYRGAWIVKDKADLQELLRLSLEHKACERIFIGVVDHNKKADDEAIYEKVLADTILSLKTIDPKEGQNYYKTLRILGNLYVKGYRIDWALLYQDEVKQRISLPTYPFAKERHWVPVAPIKISPELTSPTTQEVSTLGFYQPEWEVATLIDTDLIQLGQLLIFGDDARLIDEIARFFKLHEPNINLILVQSSTSYQCLSNAHYAIRPGIKADYEALLADVTKLYPKVAKTYVVDLWSDGAFWKDGELQLAKGIFHLLVLSQVLLAYKVSKVRLLHIYAYKDYQLSLEEMNSGFMKTLQEEHPDFFYQLIGLDDHSSSTMQLGQLIKNELNQGLDTQVRYIKNARLVHRLKSC